MRTDTLHFSSDMLGIAGTSSVAAEHDLPLAAESGHQFAGHLLDEMRYSGHLLDDGEMLRNRLCDREL